MKKIKYFINSLIDLIYPYRRIIKQIKISLKNGAVLEKLKFPISSMSEIHIYQYSKFNKKLNRNISGLGYDRNKHLALLKAFFEYFERKALFCDHQFGFKTTNGIAAHAYGYFAKRNAVNELYERDSILKHWYTQKGFSRITPKNIDPSVINELKTLGYRIYFAETTLGYGTTTCCFIEKCGKGFVLGSAYQDGSHENKALSEALINLFFGHQGMSDEELICRISKNGIIDLLDHRTFWLLLNKLPDWIWNAPSENINQQFSKGKLPIFNKLSRTPPCYGARQKGVLDLCVGNILHQHNYYIDQNLHYDSKSIENIYFIHPIA